MPHRVVITGAGVSSPLGSQMADYQHQLHLGACALRDLGDRLEPFVRTRLAGYLDQIPVPNCISEEDRALCSDLTLVVLHCAEKAVHQSGIATADIPSEDLGILVGTGMGNLLDLESTYRRFFTTSTKLSPLTIPKNMVNSAASRISMSFGFAGVCQTISTACASGSSALAEAFHLIRSGRQRAVLCGGADLLCCTTLISCWEQMRVLSPEKEKGHMACRPFDWARNGLVLADGAAFFVLETREQAYARGAPILAEIRGAYQNSDACHIVKPSAQGEVQCMQGVLRQAAMDATAVDMVYAHGTATQLNDATEVQAMQEVFGTGLEGIYLAATKGQIGHTMGASGPLAVAAALGSLDQGLVYPVPNFSSFSDEIALPILRKGAIDKGIRNIMVNAFAFGGINTALIISSSD